MHICFCCGSLLLPASSTVLCLPSCASHIHPVRDAEEGCYLRAADAQFYFSGAPWEMVARNYTAQAINLAHDGSVTQSDVMVANAMVGDWAAQTTLGVGAEQ